ncbi:MAG: secretin N-terminal domain-containing protein, partial [Thermoanaerobaculales bacterium]
MYRWLKSRSRGLALTAGLLAVLTAVGCSTAKETADDGSKAFERQNWDAAVYHYLQALAEDPGNVEYKMQLTFARQKAAQKHFRNGVALRKLGRLLAARNELQMAVQLDPTNQFAEQVLEKVEEEMTILSTPDGARQLEEMKREAREAKVKPPILNPRSQEPITLTFPKAKPVKEIYRAIGKAYGFNVLFDSKLKDDRLSVELRDLTAERSLEMMMQAAGHFYKVQDEHTIIVADDTPQNRREYEDLVIKTFFLSNAEVKDIDKLLRSLIEARRLSTNEQLNSITLRDTADKVAIAEKLIRANDKAKAEVLIDVEILIMASTK